MNKFLIRCTENFWVGSNPFGREDELDESPYTPVREWAWEFDTQAQAEEEIRLLKLEWVFDPSDVWVEQEG
jgi:hypothetical protein